MGLGGIAEAWSAQAPHLWTNLVVSPDNWRAKPGLKNRARRRAGMRLIGPRQQAWTVERPGGPYPTRGAVTEVESAFRLLGSLLRLHWVFAIAEISKGVVIVAVGDMVIAEDLGEVVRIFAVGLPEMRCAMRGRSAELGRASRAEQGRLSLRVVIRRLRRSAEPCS